MDPIYVTGHRNPDTDSIVSAIAYAALYASAVIGGGTHMPVFDTEYIVLLRATATGSGKAVAIFKALGCIY